MVTLTVAPVLDESVTLPELSLDERLGLLRRRRRLTLLKRLAAMSSVLVGMSLLLLAFFASMTSLR